MHKKIISTFFFLLFLRLAAQSQDNNKIGFNISDAFNYGKHRIAHYGLSRTDNYVTLSGWDGLKFFTEGKERMTFLYNGNVGIGIEPNNSLDVRGVIGSTGGLNIWQGHIGYSTDVAQFDYNGNKITIYGMSRSGNDVSLSGWSGLKYFAGNREQMAINNGKMDFNGLIHAKEVVIDLEGWADHVFKKDYHLPSLIEVEKHIEEKGHLPHIPSEKEMIIKGLSVAENQKLLLQKIEELTLYLIDQNKSINEQKEIMDQQIKKIEKQQEQINQLKEEVNCKF